MTKIIKYRLKQRIPNAYYYPDKLQEAEFSTIDEFFAIPLIRSWAKQDGFVKFEIQMRKGKSKSHLLACETKTNRLYMAFIWIEEQE